MAVSVRVLKIAAVAAIVAAGSMTLSEPAFARGGGGHGGGGFHGGGFGGHGFGGRGYGYGGWGYGGWGYPYGYGYGYGYGPGYYDDDYYDDAPVVVHRYHVVRDHYCRIVRKRVHTCCGWTYRKVRYCTR